MRLWQKRINAIAERGKQAVDLQPDRYPTTEEYKPRPWRQKMIVRKEVECACGCGGTVVTPGPGGQPVRFMKGHNRRRAVEVASA